MTSLLESVWVAVPELTNDQALQLEALGQSLVAGPVGDDDSESTTSLVQCRRTTSGQWHVRVNEAIGVLGCGDLTLVVQPKIELSHLVHLMSQGGALPRTSSLPASVGAGTDFWRLLFAWLLDQVERLVRRDLLKGYVATQEPLSFVRGTVDQLNLARGLLRGSTTVLCRFEEFSSNIAPNRLLKSALLMGLRSGMLTSETARRTRRLLVRFEAVGEASPGDLLVPLSRETRTYSDAVTLAKHLLRSLHRDLAHGATRAWCFLWPTPLAVEAGLRSIVATQLSGVHDVHNRSVKHGELEFRPDLVIGQFAVGDVKYSLDTGKWRRSDVNQLLAFCTAYNRHDALLLNFSPTSLPARTADIHGVQLTRLTWQFDIPVDAAESQFRTAIQEWVISRAPMADAAVE